jgi:hypothetical protein
VFNDSCWWKKQNLAITGSTLTLKMPKKTFSHEEKLMTNQLMTHPLRKDNSFPKWKIANSLFGAFPTRYPTLFVAREFSAA